jgi:hypothetical protein
MGKRSRQKRERRHGLGAASDPVLGFVAVNHGAGLCDGDALVVTGSRVAMEALVAKSPAQRWQIQPARLGHVWQAMQLGGAYAFDETAYRAFLPHARRLGLERGEQDFSDPRTDGASFRARADRRRAVQFAIHAVAQATVSPSRIACFNSIAGSTGASVLAVGVSVPRLMFRGPAR